MHRGVEGSWDISADLTELENTDVTVVCAGVKSILDIPKTLEVLETAGVPVLIADGIWVIYRVVKGWLYLNDRKAMYA